MCRKEEVYFFALSRDNLRLKKHLEEIFITHQQLNQFSWEDGEYCFFFYDFLKGRIYFGRDVFGRKSLCWRIENTLAEKKKGGSTCSTFELSVFPGKKSDGWYEVPPGTLFDIPFMNIITICTPENTKINRKIAPKTILDFRCKMECTRAEFTEIQEISIQSYYPLTHFEGNQLFQTFPKKAFKQIESNILLQSNHSHPTINHPTETEMAEFTTEFVNRFSEAVENIIRKVPLISNQSLQNLEMSVLFSGGVDSLMVALSVGDVLSKLAKTSMDGSMFNGKIRLYTVSFGDKEEDFSKTSDRGQSIIAFEHLRQRSMQKYGTNPYSLVLVNVHKHELNECRQHIDDAISPSKTVLDDSLGGVLWFASRMSGIIYGEEEKGIISSKTPFVLVGSGSDEQLGGYARHRTCFQQKGLDGLSAELSMEMHRIGERNFGRDDRVGMSNGRAILAPFLEEQFVCWLNSVPTAIKTGYSLPFSANSNKFLLRNALRFLGMPEQVVQRPKRAMQFGTGIVKLERLAGQKPKGTDICQRLVQQQQIVQME